MKLSKYTVSFNVNTESFKKINLLPFWAGLMVVVVFKLLSFIPSTQTIFSNPLPKKVEVFDTVKAKLHAKANTFTIEKQSSLIPEVQAASNADEASAYAVVDLETGNLIAQKNGEKAMPIASITKVMTAVVALDLAPEDELITISPRAAKVIPTKIGVVPGQKMRLDELLHAILLTSANDAAQVIKEGIDTKYGEPVFIKAMNEKAQAIGLKNSHFANPQGFDSKQNYSSAEDLAVLSQYALTHYPLIREIVKKDYAFLAANDNHKQYDLYNWNGLIGVYPNVIGTKIGNTDAAGVTTSVVAERNGKQILVVLLGAPGVLERDLWTAQLLDIGFEQTLGLKPVNVTEEQLRAKYKTWKYWN